MAATTVASSLEPWRPLNALSVCSRLGPGQPNGRHGELAVLMVPGVERGLGVKSYDGGER